MNKLIFITVLCASLTATAAQSCKTVTEKVGEVKEDVNTPTPKELEGATILVRLKDGSVKEMKAEQFKVVPRKQQFKVVERTLVEKTQCAPQVVVKEVLKEKEADKNILSLYVVNSQLGLSKSKSGNVTQVETETGVGVGAMYQRRFDKLYLGIGADTNEAVKLSLGLGF